MEENGFHQPENQFPPARICPVFKTLVFTHVSVSFHQQKKTLKYIGPFPLERKSFPITGMKDSFKKNSCSLDGKKAFTGRILGGKKYKNGLDQSESPFSLTEALKHSLKGTFPVYGKTDISGKKIEENGFLQQENTFLLKFVLI